MGNFSLYPEAELDLEGIWHYTVSAWSVEQAIKYIDELDATFKLLAENPLICSKRLEFQPPVRIYNFKRHLIVYVSLEVGIEIVRILHESSDIGTHLDEF